MSRLVAPLIVLCALATAAPSHAASQTILGQRLQIKNPSADATKRRVNVSALERNSSNTVVGDPTVGGATVQVVAHGGTNSNQIFTLPPTGWSRISSLGYKFSNRNTGGAVRRAQIKRTASGTFQIRVMITGRGGSVTVVPPNPGDDGGIVLTIIGGDSYCVAFGGTAGGIEQRDDAHTWQVKNPSTALCPATGTTSTTTTTTMAGATTTTTMAGGSTTTSTPVTTSTTTTTLAGPCDCCAATRLHFTTGVPQIGVACGTVTPAVCIGGNGASSCTSDGDCGGGVCMGHLDCGGLYFGGSGVAVPLPSLIPDQGTSITKITGCSGGTYALSAATDADTGSNRDCTAAGAINPEYPGKPGCLFGPPLPVPNANTSATSTCVVNRIVTDAVGSGDCGGAANINFNLASDLYLTGDLISGVPGIQPCPLCSGTPGSETCNGGPNSGSGCTPGDGDLGDAYPTSHDCPPPSGQYIGSLPIPFALTTTSASLTATDTDGAGGQTEVFCGFCRSSIPPNPFRNPPQACTSSTQCTTAPYTRCQQANEGAFGNGLAHNISVTGAAAGCIADGMPHDSTLVSVFCIPPSYNSLVDSAADLPGPGAVSLPGQAQLTDFVSTTTTMPGATTTTSVTSTTVLTTTSSTLLPPCASAMAPACLGDCGAGFVCTFNPIAMTCSCVAAP